MSVSSTPALHTVPEQRTAAEAADEALRLVGVDPREADAYAESAVALARRTHDAAAESRAWRARGRAATELGDHRTAAAHLRHAARVAETAGATEAAAEALMSLAWSLMHLGRVRAALDTADRAAAALPAGVGRARVEAQRATLT